jgi:hypothetical protein
MTMMMNCHLQMFAKWLHQQMWFKTLMLHIQISVFDYKVLAMGNICLHEGPTKGGNCA